MKKLFLNWLWLGLLPTFNSWAATGDVWLEPATTTVAANTAFGLQLRVDSGTLKIGAYGVKVEFDATKLQVDTSTTTSAITNGANALTSGFMVNATVAGALNLVGVQAEGVGTGTNLHLLTLNFKSLATPANAVVKVTVRDLTTENAVKIGTPTGWNSTVIIGGGAGVPTVTTNAATAITATSATLNGSVTSTGATATVSFDFGTTTTYGTSITATPSSVYSASAVAVTASKTGLSCGTTYHYRAKAVNSAGTGAGADKTFVTNACNYTVTATAGTGGSVTPITRTVTHGTTTTFTVTANTGYTRNSAVGGTCPAGTWNGNVWSTGAIVASCNVSFSFTLIPVPVNGTCGSANGGTFSTAPAANLLCSTGNASAVTGTGPWNWSCAGSNGGTTASCSANLQTAVINSWLYPTSLKTPRDKPFTLEVTAKSDGMQIITYSFTITFDAKLMLDPAFYAAPCNQGICPGNNALTENAITVDNRTGTINVTGVGGITAAGNDLQLLVIHFKSLAVLGASIVDLKTNVLMSNAGSIGLGTRGSTVNISTGICGDANGDTVVNIIDALAIARKVVGLPPPPTIEPLWADVDYNSRASIADALHIARYSVGLVTPPEVCAIGAAL